MRYWKRLNPDGTISTVESYSHTLDVEGATRITKQEFNAYLASLPPPPPNNPPRDLEAEIDQLWAKIAEIEEAMRPRI